MRLVISMVIMCIVLFCTSCADNLTNISNDSLYNNDTITLNIDLEQFKQQIVLTEEIVQNLFTNEFENSVIGHIKNADIVKYNGPNNTFEDVCIQLDDYCLPNVAEILMREIGYINVDGRIGFILATGETSYREFDKHDMELISMEDNIFVVKVTKNTLDGDYYKNFLYTFMINEKGKLIIAGITQE